jgi:release factor glutamine methyltransferase
MNISDILKIAAEILRESGIEQPHREAVSLLIFTLKRDRTFLIAHDDYELSSEENARFQNFLQRRAKREPLQYITGKQEFYGLDFEVSADVLIPRPETEIIVENALEILREIENPRFCEVGVGSGCISIAILHELKNTSAIGLDISEKALKIARKNAATHQVSERFSLKNSDVFNVLQDEKFDLIVSNPPYISSEEMTNLQTEVGRFEPWTALTDGKDGCSIIEKIVKDAPRFLGMKGYLLMEIGFGQAKKVFEIFDREIWQTVEILPDLQGIPRTVKARKIF